MAEPKPGSPEWLLKTLANRLHDRRVGRGYSRTSTTRKPDVRPGLDLLWSYLQGDPPIKDCESEWEEAMKRYVKMSRLNLAERVCASVSDRMVPFGWQTSVEDDADGDQSAAEIASENRFGVVLGDLWDYMLGLGSGYLMVGQPRKGSDIPTITVEDPRQVITHDHPATGQELAALKMTRDEWDSADEAHLLLPDGVRVYRRVTKSRSLGTESFRFGFGSWDFVEERSGPYPVGLDARIPVVHARNRRGVGEYEPHIDVLDRVNDTIFDRMKIAKYQAHRAMAIDGLPDKDEQGNKIDYSNAFVSEPGAMWKIPKDSKIWESATTDLSPVRMAIKDDVEFLAAATGMPLHYVTPDAAQGSAEGASTMKESTVFRTEDRRRRGGVALEEAMSLAFAMKGDKERSSARTIKTRWLPAERHSLNDKSSAFAAQRQNGMPLLIAARDVLGYGAEDLPRIESERGNDTFYAAAQSG